MIQVRNTAPQCGIKVYRDTGSLALRFPVKYNPIFEQLEGKVPKKQKCLWLKFKDIPSDWKRATRIAIDIEKDLERKLRYFANGPIEIVRCFCWVNRSNISTTESASDCAWGLYFAS